MPISSITDATNFRSLLRLGLIRLQTNTRKWSGAPVNSRFAAGIFGVWFLLAGAALLPGELVKGFQLA